MATTIHTADNTIIASAENFCIREAHHGRDAVFTVDEVGIGATWRQQRLFESAMTRHKTQGDAELYPLACALVDKYRFVNYGEA